MNCISWICLRGHKIIWRWMLAGLLSVGLVAAQDESGQQTLKRAVELHQSGHYAEAILGYESFLKAHPEAAAVRSNLGAALAHEGRYTEAIGEYWQALKVDKSNSGISFNLDNAYYQMVSMGP